MPCVYCYVTVAYVCVPRSFLVINGCNQGKTLCSPCTFTIIILLLDDTSGPLLNEIPALFFLKKTNHFWNPCVHCHIPKSLQFDPTLGQFNLFHALKQTYHAYNKWRIKWAHSWEANTHIPQLYAGRRSKTTLYWFLSNDVHTTDAYNYHGDGPYTVGRSNDSSTVCLHKTTHT